MVKRPALHEDPSAGGLASVYVDPTGPGQLYTQHHRLQNRPAPPVACRKGVEVGRERHLRLGADLQRGPGRGMGAASVGVRLFDVQLANIERFAGARQDDEGKQADRSYAHASAPGHSAPLSRSGAPSRRCGARMLSYMFSALAIAMCMSRYW